MDGRVWKGFLTPRAQASIPQPTIESVILIEGRLSGRTTKTARVAATTHFHRYSSSGPVKPHWHTSTSINHLTSQGPTTISFFPLCRGGSACFYHSLTLSTSLGHWQAFYHSVPLL